MEKTLVTLVHNLGGGSGMDSELGKKAQWLYEQLAMVRRISSEKHLIQQNFEMLAGCSFFFVCRKLQFPIGLSEIASTLNVDPISLGRQLKRIQR
jgi:transcription initiation factor TFIIIB Brf1 subunit/transcription initiation factor TFIIB